jgi:hypothetical protein
MLAAVFAAAAFALPAPVDGDFDHDGRLDQAEIVRTGFGYSLVVRRAADPRHPAVVYSTPRLGDFYLAKAKPGRWRTACGKGYGPGQDRCLRKTIRLAGDTLDFGVRESSEAVAIWTGRRFEVVWISD